MTSTDADEVFDLTEPITSVGAPGDPGASVSSVCERMKRDDDRRHVTNKRKATGGLDEELTVIGRLKRVQLLETVERSGSEEVEIVEERGLGADDALREGHGRGGAGGIVERSAWYLGDVDVGPYTDVNKMLGQAHLEMLGRRGGDTSKF